jgi:hypothetical protein
LGFLELTENGQRDVDEQIDAAATLKEDSQRGEDDGEDDLADVAGENHVSRLYSHSNSWVICRLEQLSSGQAVAPRALPRRRGVVPRGTLDVRATGAPATTAVDARSSPAV